jgi:NACHT domain
LLITAISEQVNRLRADQSSHGQLISSSLQATQDLSQTILKQIDQSASWQARVLDAIHSDRHSKQLWNVEALPINKQDQFYIGYAERFRTELLTRLRYVDMETRSHRVSDAYDKTFEWIYSTLSISTQKWSNFIHFLRSDQGLYWITGKPGSGKSTLMKFIIKDERTEEYLRAWASGKRIYISGFYFWCSGGNEIQMTQEGLLRTLLLQALRDFPHLIPLVFPNRLHTFVVFGNQVVWDEPWTSTELLWACNKFVQEMTKSHKIFFVIDGLDEFKGNYSQQITLIEFIQSLLGSNVKICVSSRPWNIFEDAFHTRPSLKLEDLTYRDIQHYVSSNLSTNLGFIALQGGDPDSASNLIRNVSTKACGVFLCRYWRRDPLHLRIILVTSFRDCAPMLPRNRAFC